MVSPLPKLLPCLVGAGCGLALVLGSARPAEAIVYNFSSASVTWSQGNGSNTYAGSGTISGSFDYSGSSPFTTFDVSFGGITNGTGTVSSQQFTQASQFGFLLGTGTSTSLLFSSTNSSATCAENSSRTCLQIQLGNTLTGSASNQVTIDTSGNFYNNISNSGNSNNKSVNLVGPTNGNVIAVGDVVAVPSPASALFLLPFSSLIFLRKRFHNLTIKPMQPVSV